MKLSTLLSLTFTIMTTVLAQIQVPVPWSITNINVYNTRHGTGGYWQLSILDSPTPSPQGFNTTCSYYSGSTYEFALDSPPYNAPCTNPDVTFGFFPSVSGQTFTLNVTHKYHGACPGKSHNNCVDSGSWHFSWDDVRGQENDAQNNFGQAGGFTRAGIAMYPNRAIPSLKCEFC